MELDLIARRTGASPSALTTIGVGPFIRFAISPLSWGVFNLGVRGVTVAITTVAEPGDHKLCGEPAFPGQ